MKFVSSIFLASVLFAVPIVSIAATPLDTRIARANETFNQVLKDAPDREIRGTMFFTSDMSLENVHVALNKSPLIVKGFRHGTKLYSGGYSLRENETLEDAMMSYRRDHAFFLQRRMETEDRMLATETDSNLRSAIIDHRKESDQMKIDYDIHGVRVIGIEVVGRASDAQDFKQRNSFVRIIELHDATKPQSSIIQK